MSDKIRLASMHDLAFVEAIVREAYARYVPRIGRAPAPMGDDYAARIAETRVHVLESGGIIQGLIVLLPQKDALLLDNVAVDPACQGSGLGRRLLAFAEQAARAAGHGVIRLHTNEAMTENIALYTRLGYAETHRGEEKGLRRVYMEKQIG
ncbi:MAG TPA: GNAT family N-acetyltransferase [Rhizomicrobium sp.]|jgi:GNAT superfamily N-acetyltransferase|nr:GNAT family N-acetyltransferase [Rhizomicrobium sp.]